MSVHAESLGIVRVRRYAGCWRRNGAGLERDAWAVGSEAGEKAARSAMGAVVLGIGLGRAELCCGLGIVPFLLQANGTCKYAVNTAETIWSNFRRKGKWKEVQMGAQA